MLCYCSRQVLLTSNLRLAAKQILQVTSIASVGLRLNLRVWNAFEFRWCEVGVSLRNVAELEFGDDNLGL